MIEIIRKIQLFYYKYGFILLTIASILLIFGLFIYNVIKGKKGKYTWYKKINKDASKKVLFSITPDDKNTSKLELKAKMILESIFQKPFIKVRPNFLHNPVTGKNLELDLYNPELRLACEVNGNQHYKYTKFFHPNGKEQFYNQQYRDTIKKMKCQQYGITLIEVPYDVGNHGIKEYILQELRKNHYLV